MPDSLVSPLPPATNDQRRRWADLLWSSIAGLRAGQSKDWTETQLVFIAKEIEPPLKPNGEPQ